MAAKIDAELDLHGYTAASARDQLEAVWSRRSWHGLRRVRIIHGTGAVLHGVVRRWADEKSIPWTLETYNPGVTILQPSLRREPRNGTINRPFARHHEKLREAAERLVRRDPEPEHPAARQPDLPPGARSAPHVDLFAQEMERLDRQDPRALHQRKHGL